MTEVKGPNAWKTWKGGDKPEKAENQASLTTDQRIMELYIDVDGVLRDQYGRWVSPRGVPKDKNGIEVTAEIEGRCNQPVKDPVFPGQLCHKARGLGMSTCSSHQPRLSDEEMEAQFLALREKHLNSADLYELDMELAGLKALIEMLTMTISKDPHSLTSTLLNSLGTATENLGKVRDRILRQMKGKAITTDELRHFFAGVFSIMEVFVKPSDHEAFSNAIKMAVTNSDIKNKFKPEDVDRFLLLQLPVDYDWGGYRQLGEELFRMKVLPLDNLSLLDESLQKFREEDDDDPVEDMSKKDVQPMDRPIQTVLR